MMIYSIMLTMHTAFRWILLILLLVSIVIASRGWKRESVFTKVANSVRHWTATASHLQLMIGITIYFQSPVVKLRVPPSAYVVIDDHIFFKYMHISLMLIAVVLITIGSAKAKRMPTATESYRTMLVWFTIALLIIFIAIPWPFSPLAARPYIRTF